MKESEWSDFKVADACVLVLLGKWTGLQMFLGFRETERERAENRGREGVMSHGDYVNTPHHP